MRIQVLSVQAATKNRHDSSGHGTRDDKRNASLAGGSVRYLLVVHSRLLASLSLSLRVFISLNFGIGRRFDYLLMCNI